MWDYLLRILKPQDVPRRPASMEFPHAADEPHPPRTSTETEVAKESEYFPRRLHAPPPAYYCPVCHVRMEGGEWRGEETLRCPECEGIFLSRHALDNLAGAVFRHEPSATAPLIYTPEGITGEKRRQKPESSREG